MVLAIVMSITRYFSHIDMQKQGEDIGAEIQTNAERAINIPLLGCIETSIISMKENASSEETEESTSGKGYEKILNSQLAMVKAIANKTETQESKEPKEEEKVVQQAADNATAGESKDELENKFTNTYGSVRVKNESKYDLTEEMLTPNMELKDKKDVLIFHTHTCESYTVSQAYNYEATGSFRSTDLNFTVAKAGVELTNQLKTYGFEVNHNQTYHDYPAYTGSYTRSLSTVKQELSKKPETQMVIDLHRDAIGSKSDYAPTVQIGEETAAKLMFVIGTNGGGLDHENWNQNLKYAVKIQEKANELYPGLFKPIILRNSRYNQQVTNAATIIEVGATGNTLDQCLVSMKYLAKVMSEVTK